MQQLISSQASNQIEEKAEIQDQQIYESDQTIIMSTPTMVYPYSIPTNAFEMNILYENQQHYQYQNLDFADLTQICPSVFQLIQRNQNLGVFEQLLVATEYDKILSQVSRKVTVFAPTDDAFLQFLQSQGTDLDSLIQDLAELRILMGYHIVNGLHNMDELRIFAMSPVVSNKLTTYLQNEQFVMELEVMQNSEGSVYIKAVGSNGTLDREMRSCKSMVHLSSGQTLGVKAQRFRGHTSPHRNVKEKKRTLTKDNLQYKNNYLRGVVCQKYASKFGRDHYLYCTHPSIVTIRDQSGATLEQQLILKFGTSVNIDIAQMIVIKHFCRIYYEVKQKQLT
eukprot:TRINITY_DN6947_c0_g2_i7.p1 TRINITY_DN6947_c0_g2~~TRINITY_DN6947_c0_g2_i7.p1  ORF type:complete len:337 (+),score=34.11 TRINITY_DN6947_c0_g2_i7:563-1573(+)